MYLQMKYEMAAVVLVALLELYFGKMLVKAGEQASDMLMLAQGSILCFYLRCLDRFVVFPEYFIS